MKDHYWHFCRIRDGKPVLRDDSPAAGPGQIERYDGELELCVRGLHASRKAIEALKYAHGSWMRLVELRGRVLHAKDKSVATERHIIASADATIESHEFSCCMAETALMLLEERDHRSWTAIETKRAWLRGEATTKELDAAWRAARRASMNAAKTATATWTMGRGKALATARNAALEATDTKAWRAAHGAAVNAGRAIAWDAGWDAARGATLDTDRDVTWDTAWSKALNEINATLEATLREILSL